MTQRFTAKTIVTITLIIIAIAAIAAIQINTVYYDQKNAPTINTKDASPIIVANETPKPLSSAEELKSLFTRDLFTYSSGYTETLSYEETPDLIELATVNAKKGTNSIRLAGDNAKDAYYAYTLYVSTKQISGYFYFASEDQNKVTTALRTFRNKPGSYGLAVYQDGNHYNVCAVLRSHHPDESVKDNSGAYSVRKVPDTITYLWVDTVG